MCLLLALALLFGAGTILGVGVFGPPGEGGGATPAPTLPASEPAGERTVVRVSATDGSITLAPASVGAGRVVLDIDADRASLTLVSMCCGTDALRPLDEEALDRLRRGDTQGFSLEDVQGAFGGPFMELALVPGRYAFVVLPADHQPGVPPVAIAVLTVEE